MISPVFSRGGYGTGYRKNKHPFRPGPPADDCCQIIQQLCNTTRNPTGLKPGLLKPRPSCKRFHHRAHRAPTAVVGAQHGDLSDCCPDSSVRQSLHQPRRWPLGFGLMPRARRLTALAMNKSARPLSQNPSQELIPDIGSLLRHGNVRPDSSVAVARHKRTREGRHLHRKTLRPD